MTWQSLEAFRVNKRAIQLYSEYGYQTVDHLLFLEKRDALDLTAFMAEENTGQYTIKHGIPQDASQLPFYNYRAPWQVRWEFIRSGESILVSNTSNNVIGYALFQKRLDNEGRLHSVVLYQCHVDDNEQDKHHVIRTILDHVFPPETYPYTRSTYLLPESNEGVVRILKEAGFQEAKTPDGIHFEQVYMLNHMKRDSE